ncbi:hypothetical protein [Arachidicoccus soli]|uniref:hypothetical protein n=1 Tax=Arachidicoccus soli TaxID=2341117 RepID=UPI0013C5261A|nr:hypothetical protein [Arachidicoccus soli]
MALSKEVLDNIAFAEKMGYTELNQFPPSYTNKSIVKFYDAFIIVKIIFKNEFYK